MNEILEGNILIAKFMGADEETTQIAMSTIGKAKTLTGRIYFTDRNPDYMYTCTIDDLRYHTSWDWLMPVVEKIEKMDFTVHIGNFSYCTISKFEQDEDLWQGIHISTEVDPIYGKVESKIHGVWLAIIQFITWYNQNKTS